MSHQPSMTRDELAAASVEHEHQAWKEMLIILKQNRSNILTRARRRLVGVGFDEYGTRTLDQARHCPDILIPEALDEAADLINYMVMDLILEQERASATGATTKRSSSVQ